VGCDTYIHGSAMRKFPVQTNQKYHFFFLSVAKSENRRAEQVLLREF
jgi:hypothetical protein